MDGSPCLPVQELPVVNSYNEWDPLEEVIVGVIDGATVPQWHLALESTLPGESWDFYRKMGGRPFPPEAVDAARGQLDDLAELLAREGVVVRRPELLDFSRPFGTPEWASPAGLYAAMPRDCLLVVGDEIIEAPMAWRSRYFETHAFRTLIKEYFQRGARWTAAPHPELHDELFDARYEHPQPDGQMQYALTEFEPTFDAADFIRCGRDVFAQRSNVTNQFGIDWLQSHLGSEYSIHTVEFNDPHPMHIDATFMPLAPGKLLVNPARVNGIPPMFRDWEVKAAPPPVGPARKVAFNMCSDWIGMNVLMLDPERVIVESREQPLIDQLRKWGFETIPVDLSACHPLGGGAHCCTLDIRRRGTLKSYF